MRLSVKVVPRASKTEVASVGQQEVRIRVAAPPDKGAANRALVAFLSDTLGLPSARVRIVSGVTRPRKIVEIDGLGDLPVRAALARVARVTIQ